ncbi:MAG: hypothetical protein CL832_10000 [Crocinitomicaceae bacterium]|nr:hypothetical protein [Crocinitomicaceae bacterium]MAW84707.1 hypothetical protein [Crocinitomicaceae bacterium]|tara:strand:+ start:193 stop:390 length:198 start_codon:yes stop_codon:yes gene_type:complete
MFKIKVKVDVIRGNTTKQETFETMVDHKTWSKLGSSGDRDEVLNSWCNSMFPGADKLRLMQRSKV